VGPLIARDDVAKVGTRPIAPTTRDQPPPVVERSLPQAAGMHPIHALLLFGAGAALIACGGAIAVDDGADGGRGGGGSGASGGEPNLCQGLENETSNGAITLRVENQTAETVGIVSPNYGTELPLTIAAGTENTPAYAPICGCTCETFMEQTNCGCTTEIYSYRPIEPGASIDVTWNGALYAPEPLDAACTENDMATECAVRRAAAAGSFTLFFEVLLGLDIIGGKPFCEAGVCGVGEPPQGTPATFRATIDYDPAIPQIVDIVVP
jgi:hypothetical protein